MKQIGAFLLISQILSGLIFTIGMSTGAIKLHGNLFTYSIMWSPGIGALLTCLLFKEKIGALGWKLGSPKYLIWAILLPIIYLSFVYGVTWATGLGSFRFTSVSILPLFWWVLGALGEEIGWRGFLVPRLMKRLSFFWTSVIIGTIWAAWHYPAVIWSEYRFGAPLWYSLLMFTVMVVGISFAFTWFRVKSGNIWAVTLLHAVHNYLIHDVFTPWTRSTGSTHLIIEEWGLGLALAGVFTAWAFYSMKKNKEAVKSRATIRMSIES